MKETQDRHRDRDSSASVNGPASLMGLRPAAAYLLPPAIAAVSACLVIVSGAGPSGIATARLLLGYGIMLVGLGAGAYAGGAASQAERRALGREYARRLDDLDHDLRGPMTIIHGEVELVLSQEAIPVAERGRSSATIIEQLQKLELLLSRRYRT